MPSQVGAEMSSSRNNYSSKAVNRPMCADWSAYSATYDLLSKHNPEYQALLQDFEAFLATIETPQMIYDIGGGTGNYTEIAARACPDSEIRFVEPDTNMNRSAQFKLAAYENIDYDNRALEDIDAMGSADLVICIHALYAMPVPEQRLADLRKLLRPGGHLYLIDIGRYMNVPDWRSYLFSCLKKELGLVGALRVLWQGREIAKQNKSILKAQKKGVYWTHTGAEFASLVAQNGFDIIRQQSVYRDHSDLLVCRAIS